MKELLTTLRHYFRTIGNPDYDEIGYWEKDPLLVQVLLGVLLAPFALVFLLFKEILSIRIKLPRL